MGTGRELVTCKERWRAGFVIGLYEKGSISSLETDGGDLVVKMEDVDGTRAAILTEAS